MSAREALRRFTSSSPRWGSVGVDLMPRLALRASTWHGRFAWAHPEWWCVALSIGAWALMIVHAVQHWGHAHHHMMSFSEEMIHWTAMIAAMMLPLTLAPVRVTAFRSLKARRHRAIVGFLMGYFAPWILLGVPVALFRRLSFTHTHGAAAMAFALAALWLWLPARRIALVECHRTMPLAPTGIRADGDCLRFGWLIGIACVITCWPLMVACSLTGHALPAMVGGAIIGALERVGFRPRKWAVLVGTLVLFGFYGLHSA
jgi:hypothetical protein